MITIGTIAKLPEKKEGYIEYARDDDFACNQCGGDIRSKTCCNPELSDKDIGYNQAIDEISQIPIDEQALKDKGYIHKSKLLGVEEVGDILFHTMSATSYSAFGKTIAKKLVQAQEKGLV